MRPIADYSTVLGPYVLLKADNEFAQDIADHVTSFEFSEEDSKPSEIKLEVLNPGQQFTDDPRFREGVRFSVRWGYSSDMSPQFTTTLVKAKPTFKLGIPTITMIAWDMRAEMNKIANPVNYGPVSSSEVARQIAKRWHMEYFVEESGDGRKQDRVQPASVSDIQYLQSLASALNWDCYIDEFNTLIFAKPRWDNYPELTLYYYTDAVSEILDFTPEVKMTKPNSTSVIGANTKDGKVSSSGTKGSGNSAMGLYKVDTYQPNRPWTYGPGPRNPSGQPGSAPSPETASNTLKAQGEGKAGKLDMSAVEGTLNAIGTPRLRTKTNVRLMGLGQTYSGVWRVKSAKHVINDKGYKCSGVKVTRNALNSGKTSAGSNVNDKSGKRGSGNGNKNEVTVVTHGGGFSPKR